MIRYIVRRLAALLPTLFLVSMLVFAIMHILPGDPVYLMLMGAELGHASPERVEALRKHMGLDQPIHIQYVRFLFNALRGDFGESIRHRCPVSQLVFGEALFTLQLSLAGLVVAFIVGLPLGSIAALYENTWIDTASMVVALFGISMPLFWLGQLVIMVVCIELRLLPALSGDRPEGIILPAITMGLTVAGMICRLVRQSLVEVLREDYIRTARAKGLKERIVIIRHGLRNALIPAVTFLGLQFGLMLAGSVLVETVFSRPGLGSLVVKSILWEDYPLVQGAVLVIAVMYALSNLLVDFLYAWLDPRIRYD